MCDSGMAGPLVTPYDCDGHSICGKRLRDGGCGPAGEWRKVPTGEGSFQLVSFWLVARGEFVGRPLPSSPHPHVSADAGLPSLLLPLSLQRMLDAACPPFPSRLTGGFLPLFLTQRSSGPLSKEKVG